MIILAYLALLLFFFVFSIWTYNRCAAINAARKEPIFFDGLFALTAVGAVAAFKIIFS